MRYFVLFFLLFLLASCSGKIDTASKYNQEYVIGDLPDSSKLSAALNEQEQLLDSIYGNYDKSIDSLMKVNTAQTFVAMRNFITNRSRILLTEVTNGVESVKDDDKSNSDGFSALCECGLVGDTLIVNTGIGFFGDAGLSIKVCGNNFKSFFYEYIDDVKPYKLTKDAEFTDNISVEGKYQYLQFDKKPTFAIGQQLTGFLTLTSNDFYENRVGKELDTNYVKVKLKFTCVTKQAAR